MYNILFSFLKPQIAFGGDSGGGGGGGGGGSTSDKKGAQAVLSAPKPVYTPPVSVITHNDNNDRPAPVVVPAPVYTPPASVIFDDDDYTPTSAELDAQLADLGATNMTDDYSIVDYSTTASGNPYIPAAPFNEPDVYNLDLDGGPIGQNTQSEALIGQATDIGGGVYDPINILSTDAYQLGTGNAIMPPVNPVYDPLDDSNAFTSVNPTNAYDTADIYSEPVVDTYDPLDNDFVDRNPTNAFDVANIYANDELATSVYDQPADEMDFVQTQGPVQAAPIAPPGDEMDFVPMQGPSPMPGFFEGDVDSGTFSNTNSIDSNFYDEIMNSKDLGPAGGAVPAAEYYSPTPDDGYGLQPEPVVLPEQNVVREGEYYKNQFTDYDRIVSDLMSNTDQYDLANFESNRFPPPPPAPD